jgi:hypothetical protein
MTEHIEGELEIDHDRGVIYFHATSADALKRYGVVTILRLGHLPRIPHDKQLDIVHMHKVGWE